MATSKVDTEEACLSCPPSIRDALWGWGLWVDRQSVRPERLRVDRSPEKHPEGAEEEAGEKREEGLEAERRRRREEGREEGGRQAKGGQGDCISQGLARCSV